MLAMPARVLPGSRERGPPVRQVPMSIADACLVRLTETLPDPLLLTTDSDFRIYRRLGRRVIPVRIP